MLMGILLIGMLSACGASKDADLSSATGSSSSETPTSDETSETIDTDTSSTPPVESAEWGWHESVFGFAGDGNKIIVPIRGDLDTRDYPDPTKIVLAYGNGGEILKVRYVNRQEESAENTYRDTSQNFDNLAGFIYEVTEGMAKPNANYLLATASAYGSLFTILNSLELNPPLNDEGYKMNYEKAPAADIARMELRRGRNASSSGLIWKADTGERLEVIQFEAVDEEMLYCLCFFAGDSVYIENNYTESGGWRVDDGGDAVNGELFKVNFVMACGDFGYYICVDNWAPEGCYTVMYTTDGGRLDEDGTTPLARYTSP